MGYKDVSPFCRPQTAKCEQKAVKKASNALNRQFKAFYPKSELTLAILFWTVFCVPLAEFR